MPAVTACGPDDDGEEGGAWNSGGGGKSTWNGGDWGGDVIWCGWGGCSGGGEVGDDG